MAERRAPDETVQRLIAFSDGVIAIAITLLALDVRLPSLSGPVDNAALLRAIRDLWPHAFSFAVSFAVIGLYWMAHRRVFAQIPHGDEGLVRLNLLFLFCIALLPFASDVIGDHGDLSVAAIVYALCVAATGLSLWLLSWHAYRQRLQYPPLSRRAFWLISTRVLAAPAIFLLSIPIALASPAAATYSWVLVWPVMAVHARLSQALLRETQRIEVSADR